jgi:hypothetical protein
MKKSNQEKALISLLKYPTVKEASEKTGIGEATFYRYLADPTFMSEYRAAKKQLVEGALTILQTATEKAVTTLIQIMEMAEPPTGSGVRVSCARLILESSIRMVHDEDILSRIEKLEEVVKK